MLQIVFSLFILLLITFHADAQTSPEWILEDAYQKEYEFLNDAKIILPPEEKKAVEFYREGLYSQSIEILQKIRDLNLPDGRLDFIAFILAESFRKTGLLKRAEMEYSFIVNQYPESDKTAPSLLRMIEISGSNGNLDEADSLLNVFKVHFENHPLRNAAFYACGKSHYMMHDLNGCLKLLSNIGKTSVFFPRAQFVTALCFIQRKEFQKALMLLDFVRKKAYENELKAEACLVIGDIYYRLNNIETALKFFKCVTKNSSRYAYSKVKCARADLDLKKYSRAAKLTSEFLQKHPESEFYFEMSSILEQAYIKMGKRNEAALINKSIENFVKNARIEFEIYDENSKLKDVYKKWQLYSYEGLEKNNTRLINEAEAQKSKILELQNRQEKLLSTIGTFSINYRSPVIPYLAERRYLALLKEKEKNLDDSLKNLADRTGSFKAKLRFTPQDSLLKSQLDSISSIMATVKNDYDSVEHEYNLVINNCLDDKNSNTKYDEQIQVKFVDWAFIKFIDKKNELKRITQLVAERKKKNNPKSGTENGKRGENFTDKYRDSLSNDIISDREKLVRHMESILELYPKDRYNPQLLFRLAELYYDQAGDEFDSKLKNYEKRMASGSDTAGLRFPEYDLSKPIGIYDKIIKEYPDDDIADNACFYKALDQKKQGFDDEANKTLLMLTAKYPESEFYVEANMNIGSYYFDHPKIENGQGYKLAEDAYRKVLVYRDHPQFVQALYHLGWCYYMQDRYDDAIAVFKYLVEEADLDFDPSKSEEKQVLNPLLRDEAIDYIAISFDEEERIDDALKFLQLIGNADYAALVLKRMGELREEDLDFNNAVKVYRRLLQEFPLSTVAPQASVSLIKLFDSREMADSTKAERERFFSSYGSGSKWQEIISKKDTALQKRADSMAVSIGLFVSDDDFRRAENTRSNEDYVKAAEQYRKVVEKYPSDPRASEARWNLAVILESKLGEKMKAYDEYISYSRLTGVDSLRREQAALNAVAIAQFLLPPDSAVKKGDIDFAAVKLIDAVKNYLKLFPGGGSSSKVILSMGAVYFNRQMYSKASEAYQRIIDIGKKDGDYYQAIMLKGQCDFSEEKWPLAASQFEIVWKESNDNNLRGSAIKFLLQSNYLYAKKLMSAGEYENAAEAFRIIDDKYPGSEYGDIVLFNASEAYEKKEFWEKACDSYNELVKRYPQSKLAADALFNAAEDFVKANKYDAAAETYQKLIDQYSTSDKAKDALFNLGFCYEKLGKLDKMAEANELYSLRYPGEKDVEAMLLRSAAFYAKAGMADRAVSVYRNFITRFPNSPKTVEAFLMTAKCSYDKGDLENALLGFERTEQQNALLQKGNFESDNFHAAEAAAYIGEMLHEKFLDIKLLLPEDQLGKSLKQKTEYLNEASKAYQRVIQYRSERMFEAAYKIGKMYEELSESWDDQERPKLDPIKQAVAEKEILEFSSQCLQKTFVPYRKAFELAEGIDSLSPEQKSWIEKSRSSLMDNYLNAGRDLYKIVKVMNEAPVPKEIKDEPLHYYQYLKQLLETLAPMKAKVRDYYAKICDQLDTLKVDNPKADSCRLEFAKVNFLIGNGYDNLSTQILKGTQDLPKDMPSDQKEELIFQLEDIIYELQDKAIFAFEESLEKVKKRNLQSSIWYSKILESLARLSPEKYGAKFFLQQSVVSDETWLVRSDSIAKWNSDDPPKDGWEIAKNSKVKLPAFPNGFKPWALWSNDSLPKAYLWKNIFLNGSPRNASVYISCGGKYKLYVNGALTLNDTIGNRSFEKIDSAAGITALVKGGDNVITISAEKGTVAGGVSILFTALEDTTQHFTSTIRLPSVALNIKNKALVESTNASSVSNVTDYVHQFRNKGELLKTINDYQKKETDLNNQIKKERLEMQKIKMKSDDLDNAILKIKEEILKIKATRDSMSAGK